MTRALIETAVHDGIPFALNVANGESYAVRVRNEIALNSSRVVVVDDCNQAHVFPLSAITGIDYLPQTERLCA